MRIKNGHRENQKLKQNKRREVSFVPISGTPDVQPSRLFLLENKMTKRERKEIELAKLMQGKKDGKVKECIMCHSKFLFCHEDIATVNGISICNSCLQEFTEKMGAIKEVESRMELARKRVRAREEFANNEKIGYDEFTDQDEVEFEKVLVEKGLSDSDIPSKNKAREEEIKQVKWNESGEIRCYTCNEVVKSEDENYEAYFHNYCRKCWNEIFFSCSNCGNTYIKAREIQHSNGKWYCKTCFYERGYKAGNNKEEEKNNLRYVNCNGVEIKISNKTRALGSSWLWQLANKQKSLEVGEAMRDIHGIFCTVLAEKKIKLY